MAYKQIIKHSLLYFSSTALSKIFQFSLIPIITYYLTPKEYGNIGVFISVIGFISIFIGMSPHVFIGTNFFIFSDKQRKNYLGSILSIILISSIIAILAISIYGDLFGISVKILVIGILSASLIKIFMIQSSILQMRAKPVEYAKLEISRGVIGFVAMISLLSLGLNWESKAYADLITSVLLIVYIYTLQDREILRIRFNIDHINFFLKYSIPLIPHSFALVGLSGIDILFLKELSTPDKVGIYTFSTSVSLMMYYVLLAIDKSLSAYILRTYGQAKHLGVVLKIFSLLLIVSLVSIVVIYFSIKQFDVYIFDSAYLGNEKLIAILTLGYAIYALLSIPLLYVYRARKTKFVALISTSSLIINVVLNYILIPIYGIFGAACATLISYTFMFLLSVAFSVKFYNLNNEAVLK